MVLPPAIYSVIPAPLIEINLEDASAPFLGGPMDIPQAAAFLASDYARFITGHTLPVDGGILAMQSTVPAARCFFAEAAAAAKTS